MANNPIEQSPQPELPPADDSALSLEQDSQTDETDRAIDEIQHNDSDTELEAAFAPQILPEKQTLWQKYLGHKKWTIPATILIVSLIIIFGLPLTRYTVLGLIISKQYAITLTDSQTHKPVSQARVKLGNLTVTTDGSGKALFAHVKVGKKAVMVTKQYYKSYSTSIFVGLSGANESSASFVPTGRQVRLVFKNRISGEPVRGATVSVAGTSATSDTGGVAYLVVPAVNNTLHGKLIASGYITGDIAIDVSPSPTADQNTYKLVPSGRVYFLSNKSGKVDVVSTNFDGSDRQTLLAGTGYEEAANTTLLPSPDQKYVAVIGRRSSDNQGQGVYIIATATGKLSKLEELASASFYAVGWSNDSFVYTTNDYSVSPWQQAQQMLKSYNTASQTGVTLDQTDAEGTSQSDYATQSFTSTTALVDNTIVYAKNWSASYNTASRLQTKNNIIYSIQPNGSGKKPLRELTIPDGTTFSTLAQIQAGPHTTYFEVPTSSNGPSAGATFFKYFKGGLTQTNNFTYADFTSPNNTNGYVSLSPDGTASLFQDSIDGHLVVSMGDSDGTNKQKIITMPTDGYCKGWLGNEYVVVVQNTNQLVIISSSARASGAPLVVSDFLVPPAGRD
jgi:hypothetical protein